MKTYKTFILELQHNLLQFYYYSPHIYLSYYKKAQIQNIMVINYHNIPNLSLFLTNIDDISKIIEQSYLDRKTFTQELYRLRIFRQHSRMNFRSRTLSPLNILLTFLGQNNGERVYFENDQKKSSLRQENFRSRRFFIKSKALTISIVIHRR